jgi:acylphosphatase
MPAPIPEARCHAFVSGTVQGVGFRYFVVDAAGNAGAVGWVRNRRDGRVELVAEGSHEGLERLLASIRRGPRGGRVEEVEVAWEEPQGEFDGFRLQATV